MLRRIAFLSVLAGMSTMVAVPATMAPASASTATVSAFYGGGYGCAGANLVPALDNFYFYLPLPLPIALPPLYCVSAAASLPGESAAESWSAPTGSTGQLAASSSATNGNQVIGEGAYAGAFTEGSANSPTATSSIDIVSDFTTGTLSSTGFQPSPVPYSIGSIYLHSDDSYAYANLGGYGPRCSDGTASASTNSLSFGSGYPPGTYVFKTSIYCPDHSTVSAGSVYVAGDLYTYSESNNGSSQHASGSMTLLDATFTFNS
ncbi:MAG TPA: hypothetical protein VMV14_10560 [Acidimicrobiales bacterium]|nr:hypothetical protein [Acidimicrobiales bacterium]